MQAFERWQSEFDESLNQDDPPDSKLDDPDRFGREGRQLVMQLQAELGASLTVRYWADQAKS